MPWNECFLGPVFSIDSVVSDLLPRSLLIKDRRLGRPSLWCPRKLGRAGMHTQIRPMFSSQQLDMLASSASIIAHKDRFHTPWMQSQRRCIMDLPLYRGVHAEQSIQLGPSWLWWHFYQDQFQTAIFSRDWTTHSMPVKNTANTAIFFRGTRLSPRTTTIGITRT